MIVRRTLAALAIGAVFAGATATAASAGVPEGMTKAADRALHIRSEALNNLYGNAVTRLSPAQFAANWNAGASRLSPDEFNALVVRSEGLNSYGNLITAARGRPPRRPPSLPSDRGRGRWAALRPRIRCP